MTGGNGAIIRCSVPPSASCPTYDDDLPAEHTFLSATMTVGTRITSGISFLGWDDSGRFTGASLTDQNFTFGGDTYDLDRITLQGGSLTLSFESANAGDIATQATRDKLTLHVGSDSFHLGAGTLASNQQAISWASTGLSWAAGDSVQVKITGPHPTPNAYGYRTIWTALMTAEVNPNDAGTFGFFSELYGKLTNNIIVNGRTDRGVVDDQFRYPWSGYEIKGLYAIGQTGFFLEFYSDSYPTADEVAGWTLVLPGGKELPFPNAPVHNAIPHKWGFSYVPNWTDKQQLLVSIRTKDVQNRVAQVVFKAGDAFHDGKVHRVSRKWPSGSSYILPGPLSLRGPSGANFGVSGHRFSLETLEVLRKGTDDEDPVWITATFRAPNEGISWTAYWEGEFEQFHTLFLRWYDNINKRPSTYTLPLRSAATEGGIQRRGRYVSFVWVRTYKEFERRGLALGKQGNISADFLAPPKPATRRAVGEGGDGFSQHGVYDPAPTVTSVGFTSNPGSDRVYGPGDTIEVTVTFDQEVTVRYVGSKRQAASLELEMNGETRTAYYERTDGKKVIFEYTVLPGDEAPVALKLPLNSLKLFSERGRQDGSIQNSEGTDAVLDHYGLANTGHRVDAVRPEFASAQVSNDGTQVMVTLTEDIKSPSILRAFGLQTGLLQSLALDVWVDGELPVRSDATVSGDTVTLTMSEPITQGQTVTVSYDNLFIETGESIFEDLHGNSLLPFAEQPAANHSTVADVNRPGGGLALSRTDLLIKEGQSGTYTVALTSQPAADVTVAIGDHPAGRATVSPTSLTFTADNWNTPQTVTISSTEDSDYVDRWVLLQHVATGDNYGASAAAWLILRDNYNLTTTAANTPATGSPTISGTPQVGQTLTLDISEIADADGLTNASHTYLYQWLWNGAEIPEATDTSYTLVDADEGKTIKVKVSFTDDANNAESRTSAATVAVAPRPNSSPTGAPTINGTPQVRRTLMVDTSEIADADGMETAVFRYQWFAASDFATLEFHGENSPTYTLAPFAEGLAIKVKVSFTDDRGQSETLTSAATEAVIAAEPNSEPTGLPTIDGTPQVGETLTADTSAIDDADGLTNVSYRYQWVGSQSVIDADTGVVYILTLEIPDQTGSTYTLAPADEGWTIKVRVSFTDDAGNEETLTSAATAAVASRPNTPATGAPTISRTAQVDQTLTADTSGITDADGLTNLSYSYQWIRNDGTNDADIGGQTGSTYTLTDEDVGKTIKVRVSFTDDAGNEETLTSAATAAVAARPNTPATGLPTISGTAQAGKTLTANISGMADEDGLDNAEFSYQWLANDADIQNATDSTYTLTDDDVGKTIKVRVSFTDDRSNDETLTSAATDTVFAKPDSPDTDAPPRDPGATVDVTVGNTVTGEIEEAIEVDWFKVSLLASETYQIDMRGAWGGEWARIDGEIVWVAPGTLHDPKLLGVLSAANVLVPGTDEEVSGDDRGDYEEGKNSRITSFSPPADGYYYIAAAAEAAWTGTYELTVTVVADE